jgi:hypothetical protein
MSDALFDVLLVAVVALNLAYLIWFVYGALKHDMLWISMESLNMYMEVAKAVIIGAGIVASVLAAAMISPSAKAAAVRPTVLCLGLAIFFSVLLIMILTRSTETAIGRELRRRASANEPVLPNETIQGHLHWMEFLLSILSGGISLATFMLGILFLVRLAYTP